jgi:hypothetical protein
MNDDEFETSFDPRWRHCDDALAAIAEAQQAIDRARELKLEAQQLREEAGRHRRPARVP